MANLSGTADIKQDTIFKNRISELAKRSYSQGIYTFTDFLNQSELSDVLSMREISYASPNVFGGADFCERKIVRFGDETELGYSVGFPINIVEAIPVSGAFSRTLTHRDYLGSLMNLGVERSCIGDICLKDNKAYIFCVERMSGFICENLLTVSREKLKCRVLDSAEELPQDIVPKLERRTFTVSSNRLDCVISAVYGLSRAESLETVKRGEVFVSQKVCLSPSETLDEMSVVSVRGKGKFVYVGVNYISRKGKSNISADMYV